jgi:Ca-activated chloride channel family protein
MLRKEDFNDDAKDAGEIGAGHTVTALYEVALRGVEDHVAGGTDPLKYQQAGALTPAAHTHDLLTVKIRYKPPQGETSQLLSRVVGDGELSRPLAQTSDDFRFAQAVAAFGMLLRESPDRGDSTWEMVDALARGARGSDEEGYRKEFLALVHHASKLTGGIVMGRPAGPAGRRAAASSQTMRSLPGFSVIMRDALGRRGLVSAGILGK